MKIIFKEPEKEVKKIAKFLGVELIDEQVKSIVAFTSFKNMKEYLDFVATTPELFKENMVIYTFFLFNIFK